jgi:hypothetical protein
MTQDEIIEMARQAGIRDSLEYDHMECDIESLEAFAKLVAQHEREAWVKVCDEMYYAFQVKRKIETKLDEEKV